MSTRRRTLAERVGDDYGWLLGQFVVLGAVALGGPAGALAGLRLEPGWPWLVDAIVGGGIIAYGFVVAWQSRADLGDSLRVAPTPLDDARLVESGWYGRVRHPLYFAVLLVVVGWTLLWLNYLSLTLLPVVAVFFRVKAGHEERLLAEAYAGYAGYMERVRSRFVPRVW